MTTQTPLFATRTGICTTDFPMYKAEELFSRAKSYGFDVVQFGFQTVLETQFEADGKIEFPDFDTLPAGAMDAILRASERSGVAVTAINGTFNARASRSPKCAPRPSAALPGWQRRPVCWAVKSSRCAAAHDVKMTFGQTIPTTARRRRGMMQRTRCCGCARLPSERASRSRLKPRSQTLSARPRRRAG